jgi:hypothetical protein
MVPDFFVQNRLRNGTGTGTGTRTCNVLSFSCGFRRSVGTGGVQIAGRAARRRWGGKGGFEPCCEVADELNGALNRGFFPVVFTNCGHFFDLILRSASARFLDEVFSPGF